MAYRLSHELPSTSPSEVLSILQNPNALIRLNPLVISSTQDSQDPSLYHIVDSLEFLYGWVKTTTRYTAKFENTDNGVKTISRAGMGVVISASWRVEESTDKENCVVIEEGEISAPRLLMWYVRSTHNASHTEMMESMKKEIEKRRKLNILRHHLTHNASFLNDQD